MFLLRRCVSYAAILPKMAIVLLTLSGPHPVNYCLSIGERSMWLSRRQSRTGQHRPSASIELALIQTEAAADDFLHDFR